MISRYGSVLASLGVLLVAGCATKPPAAYHDMAQHPFELRESTSRISLAGLTGPEAEAQAAQFAAVRPNNGSSFTIPSNPVLAHSVRTGLINAGVAPADIVINPLQPAELARIDRIVVAVGCSGSPASISGFGVLDDGFGHDNANSALLGCAIQRNIAVMMADPRTLFAPDAFGGRDGARAAEVYGRWTRGQPTESTGVLPTEKTSQTPGGG